MRETAGDEGSVAGRRDYFSAEQRTGLNNLVEPGGTFDGDGVEKGGAPCAAFVDAPVDRSAVTRSSLKLARSHSWPQRCERLFQDLRRPARAMVARAYGRALSDDELDDVYAAAWAATLAALRGRGDAMSDDELRAYVLTAVASHASKELRRRSRKPAGSLEESHEQALFDRHAPLPDERAIGSESKSIARDLLSSLPARRRAVMLLRYGWGLSPKEVCALVAGLSPRAYRKEVTRGVEQLIDRLKQVESGEWCVSREPILRDYVAGTAGEEARRQATQHIHHCRACADLVARLSGHLHDFGSSIALASVAGSIGERKLPVLDRVAELFDRGRETASATVERSESTLTTMAGSGGARGSGTAGAGIAAKLAGLGAVGKGAALCIGAGAVATACVAAGVLPGVSLPGGADDPPPVERKSGKPVRGLPVSGLAPFPNVDTVVAVAEAPAIPANPSPGGQDKDEAPAAETSEPAAPAGSTAPSAPPEDQEFGLPSSTAVAPAPSSSGAPSSNGGTSDGAGASASEISKEFGP